MDGCIIPLATQPPDPTIVLSGAALQKLEEQLREWAKNPPPEVIRVFREILGKFDGPNLGPPPISISATIIPPEEQSTCPAGR